MILCDKEFKLRGTLVDPSNFFLPLSVLEPSSVSLRNLHLKYVVIEILANPLDYAVVPGLRNPTLLDSRSRRSRGNSIVRDTLSMIITG